MTLNRNGNTFTPNLGDKNTFTPNLEDKNTWIPNLEDTNLHLVNAIVQFLNREKGKNKDNSEFLTKVNDAISNLTAAFVLADYSSNQLQVHDNIEQIFYLAVRYDLLKANVEGFAKNNKQSFSNTPENVSMVPQENGSDKESNNEESVSIDDTINYENTAELNNKARNTKDDKLESNPKHTNGGNVENNTQHELNSTAKDEEMHVDPGERILVFIHCDVCKKTFNEEIELKEHKEDWRLSSWSCASGARFPEKKYCGVCKESYSVRYTFEHQKRCKKGKTKKNVNILLQSDVLTTHKRAHPDVEKDSQNEETSINKPRSKISKKNNVEENIITEFKEEYDDNNCSIDIKEETIEEEGDPLSSVDLSLSGSDVQVDPSLPGSDVQDDPSLPGSHVQDDPSLPGSHVQDDPSLPGSHVQDDPSLPGSHVQDDPSLPGSHVQDDPSLPGSNVQDDPSLPGSHVQDDPSLPGSHIEDDPSMPGSHVQDDPSLPGRHVEGELHYPVDENNQQYTEVNHDEMTKGYKRKCNCDIKNDWLKELKDDLKMEIRSGFQSTEMKLTKLKEVQELLLKQQIQYGELSIEKLNGLSLHIPTIVNETVVKDWRTIRELESRIGSDENQFRRKLASQFVKFTVKTDGTRRPIREAISSCLRLSFRDPEEASEFTAKRSSYVNVKDVFPEKCPLLNDMIRDACTNSGNSYDYEEYFKLLKDFFQNISKQTREELNKKNEKRKAEIAQKKRKVCKKN